MARATKQTSRTQTSRSGRTPAHSAKAAPTPARGKQAAAAAKRPAAQKPATATAKRKRGAPLGTKRTTEVDGVIGAKIRMRRSELGMTQTQLANKLGVTFQQVQKYEQGKNRVGGSRLAGVAKALESPISYFFDQSGEELEAVQGSLLHTRGAVSLLRAYASIKDERQRHALLNLSRAMIGEEPLPERGAEH